MLTKLIRSNKNKIIFSFVSALIFIYIILFEFILPANKILPKPSILIDTVPSLFADYNFLSAFLFTFSSVYIMMLLSYFLINIAKYLAIPFAYDLPGITELMTIWKYLIPLFLILLFNLWFGDSIWGEFLFILILMMGGLKTKLFTEIKMVEEEYITASKSLGLSGPEVVKKIIWKSIQPRVFDTYIEQHIFIWSMVLVYEYVCMTEGIGNIFRLGLKYNDLSVTILLIAIMILVFLIMEIVLKNIKKKFFFWN